MISYSYRLYQLTALLLLGLLLFGGRVVSAEANLSTTDCIIPPSGPWPPCATGGGSNNGGTTNCVIPPSGPWPPCATGGGNNGGSTSCVIPPSGPWPPCATGGGGSNGSNGGATNCVIPPSGPWPPCATGGGGGTPSTTPQVQSFSVPAKIVAGDALTVRWQISGLDSSDQIMLVERRVNSFFSDETRHLLPSSGEFTLATETTDDDSSTARYEFWLERQGKIISAVQSVGRDCTYQWFFLPPSYDFGQDTPSRRGLWGYCASEPEVSQASQQQFEGGFMVWIAKYDQIWVYTNSDKRLQKFTDTFVSGVDPVSSSNIVPPAGRLQPEFGFGKVWRNNPMVREALGWATHTPNNYETVNQGNATDFRNQQHFLRLANGNVLLHEVFTGVMQDVSAYSNINGFAHPRNGFRVPSGGGCVIPPSGPWPPCATGG